MTHTLIARAKKQKQKQINPKPGSRMNRTSRTDEPYEGELEGYNQSPNPLSPALTTNRDLNGIVNTRTQRDGGQGSSAGLGDDARNRESIADLAPDRDRDGTNSKGLADGFISISQPLGTWFEQLRSNRFPVTSSSTTSASPNGPNNRASGPNKAPGWAQSIKHGVVKFFSFVGPGFMVAVAYSKYENGPEWTPIPR
jgi:metal iron transporter